MDTASISRVYEAVERPSVSPFVRLSLPSTKSSSGGFAAERPAGRRYRSITGAASLHGAQQQMRACHIDSRGTRLNTDLFERALNSIPPKVTYIK